MPGKLRAALAAALAFLPACHGSLAETTPVRAEPGGPLPGLTRAERAAFERGKLVFKRRFRPEDGLGPLYNATSCESCHSVPGVGGSAPLYRNFFLAMQGPPGRQAPLSGLPSAVVPAFGHGEEFTTEGGRMTLDGLELGLTLAQRNSLPLFGVGLFEFVSDATILARADPNDENGDGISGRFNTDAGAIGRFGVKAQSNNIELFTRAPLNNQLGITSDPFLGSAGIVSLAGAPRQVSSDPNRPTRDEDGRPDPEISERDLGDLIAFTRFLAPVQPLLPMSRAAQRGAERFLELGCALCHVPELASSRGPVRAYTDLLLHDLGAGLADGLGFGVPQAAALAPPTTAGEFRTQPLWGVSLSAPYLHDGRAESLRQAVEWHDGEARTSRERFQALPAADQDDLLAFLEHL
jgi:CxxC motif-containing protein (DUF1111 family)